MRSISKFLLPIATISTFVQADTLSEGKKVFETYCWGCHHQTAVAFGPSFSQMAAMRTKQEIEAYIIEPKAMYEAFGHKRSVMPVLELSEKERSLVADYIISYRPEEGK